MWGRQRHGFNPTQFVLNSAVTAAGKFQHIFEQHRPWWRHPHDPLRPVPGTSPTSGRGTFSGIISNGGIIKTGVGLHVFSGTNTYSGGTTLEDGTLQLGNNSALGSTSAALTVNGGLLNINNYTVSVGNLTGTGGTIANNGSSAITFTIGNGGGTGGNFQGVIANNTNAGTGITRPCQDRRRHHHSLRKQHLHRNHPHQRGSAPDRQWRHHRLAGHLGGHQQRHADLQPQQRLQRRLCHQRQRAVDQTGCRHDDFHDPGSLQR